MQTPLPSLVDLWEEARRRFAERGALAEKQGGEWSWITYEEVGREVDRVRAGLASLGVRPGERVAIISNNRIPWVACAYATYGLEAELVPMYEAQLPKEWEHILSDSGATVAIAATEPIHRALSERRATLPALRHVVGLDLPAEHPDSYARLRAQGDARPVPARRPRADAVAGFFYTSGTTGLPKGVVLTHANLVSNILAMREVFPLEPGEISLSFLPWAHAFGQVCELQYGLTQGMSIAINDDIPNLVANLSEVRPTILVAVPRVFNRIYTGVMQQIAHRPAVIRRMFADGLEVAAMHRRGQRASWFRELELRLDDRLIFSKIRDRFGGRLRKVISGSAALSLEVAELIEALGIEIYEGYGLSETSPVVSANTPRHQRLGSVGRVLPGVRVVIDETRSDLPGEGEILVYGPNVMRGYHERPEENAAAFTADGGFRTGDLGHLDPDGFLHITGRIKEQYKLENGKYVMPTAVEDELKLSPFIANAMVYGDGRPYNVALVVPDRAALTEWAEREGVGLDGDPLASPRVHALLMGELEARRESLRTYEVPKRLLLLREDFTTDNGLLTPTLKLKRAEVLRRHREQIERLYASDAEVRVA